MKTLFLLLSLMCSCNYNSAQTPTLRSASAPTPATSPTTAIKPDIPYHFVKATNVQILRMAKIWKLDTLVIQFDVDLFGTDPPANPPSNQPFEKSANQFYEDIQVDETLSLYTINLDRNKLTIFTNLKGAEKEALIKKCLDLLEKVLEIHLIKPTATTPPSPHPKLALSFGFLYLTLIFPYNLKQ